MALIEVRNVSKAYRGDGTETQALSGVTFDIRDGEFVAIIGPSGSGKSTLLHILGFLDRPSSGEYRFQGEAITEYSERAAAEVRNSRMGFIFQMFNLLPRASVFENVALPLLYSSVPEKEWDERTRRAVEAVGLTHRIRHEPAKLSGGEQQRVAIARALVTNPALILADEPTGNLDTKSGGEIMEILAALNASGHTIILITHETYTAEYAGRIIGLRDGRIERDEAVANRRTTRDHFMK
ncbi:MAG: macrolide ABC transporter ATP-binding protein [Candidatus Sungbacteria bacterium RIFCSPLOWO2_01_FULL_59_16]|uniref:Macrolide ABC transporter ATP-binding protein n=1 Tax=Candidatus Sungbacteria bacterium RIFCSPLOWO2_01_FULL_59_16 TaxID=1802280 RepID=A0A1G2LCT7_9BACT|nr:MAG: macrolide ABC transporter ATP-binding protein [Candidatus Sungbacteria bacterium RIFCSPLOWO2_01_FULL_59_16]